MWEHKTFLEILDDLEYRDTITNKRKKLDAPLDSAIPCTNSACRKEHFSSKLQPSFFVLLAFGRMPLVSQWTRANLFEILSTCLPELCTRRSTSYGRSTFRTTVFHRFPSVISMQERESKRSLPHFTFSTFARMVSVAVFGFPWKAIWLLFFFGEGREGEEWEGGSGERERTLRGRGRPMALSLMWHACCGKDAKRKTQREVTVRNNERKRKQKNGFIRWPSDRLLMHELMATLERFHLTCSLHEGLDDHGLGEWTRTEWSLVVTWVGPFPGKWLIARELSNFFLNPRGGSEFPQPDFRFLLGFLFTGLCVDSPRVESCDENVVDRGAAMELKTPLKGPGTTIGT